MSEYQKLTVVKLKELLKDRGLPVAGKKADLIERLEDNDAQTAVPGRQALDTEAEVAPDQEPANGQETSQLSAENETTGEPSVAQTSEPPVTHEEEHPVTADKGANEEVAAVSTTNSIAADAASKEPSPVRADLTDDQQAIEAKTEAPNGLADLKEESAAELIQQNGALPILKDQQVKNVAGKPQNETEDTIMEDIHETKQESTSPALSDSQAMPAPELPASQIPRPSIETQQTPEPRYDLQKAESNSGMEGITRTTTMSSVNTQELLEDRMKRKRRSHSPPISSTEVAIKKAKALDGSPRATLTQEGNDSLPTQDSMEFDSKDRHDRGRVYSSGPNEAPAESQGQDTSQAKDQVQEVKQEPEDEDQPVIPSRYSATNCLYISNLMRPLQPNALKMHLEKLAGSGTKDNAGTIGLFFLESTRRYGIASFSSIAAASRARLGLHDRVWPDESNRKALFVDFIPEDKANEIIEMEEDNANKPRLERQRFEILYVERNGQVTPEIHNADSPAALQHRAGQTSSATASINQRKPSVHSTLPPPPPREETGKNFKALDDLFPSTIAKPRLYYLPSSTEVAERRLDILSRATMREEPRKSGSAIEEKRRYTFEDGDIVDKGPEFGFGRGGSNARGRGGGPSDRGNFRGRGRGGPRNDYRSGAGIGYHDRW